MNSTTSRFVKARTDVVIVDSLLIIIASLGASQIKFGVFGSGISGLDWLKILLFPTIWIFVLYGRRSWDVERVLLLRRSIGDVLSDSLIVFLSYSAMNFLFKLQLSRLWVLTNVILTCFLLVLSRLFWKRWLPQRVKDSIIKLLYISENKDIPTLEDWDALCGYQPTVIFSMNLPSEPKFTEWQKNLRRILNQEKIGTVLIDDSFFRNQYLLREIISDLQGRVFNVLLTSESNLVIKSLEPMSPNLSRVKTSNLFGRGLVFKRLFDIVVSFMGLVFLSPLLILTAILVKVTSSGPIFYMDERVGQGGEKFKLPKFRSMVKNAHELRGDVIGRPDEAILERYKNDPRITLFGKFIRRWSLDELPQLWLVLIGKMSIVGPRPILLEEQELVSSEFERRHIVKPGLTGLWQVNGRKEVPWKKRMEYDLFYLENWSFLNDFLLILKTVNVILKGYGAL